MFCNANDVATDWTEFQRVAAEVGVDLTDCNCAGLSSREECCTFLAEVLQPKLLPRGKAITYWNAVVQVLKSKFTSVQVEEVEGDQSQDEDLILHAHFASQASGVVNVHDVDAAM
jgi:hypothetical protein